MIRWLWDKMLKWGWDYNRGLREEDTLVPLAIRGRKRRHGQDDMILVSDNEIELTDPIRFSVQNVSGGTLIETRWHDPKQDEYVRKLHIVTQDENLAEAIGKIVTMELLKR
jgi:hypothetical protein